MKCINIKTSLSLSLIFRCMIQLCDISRISKKCPQYTTLINVPFVKIWPWGIPGCRGQKVHLGCTECIVLESSDAATQSELCHKPKYFSSFFCRKISLSSCQKKCRCFQLISGTFLFSFGSRLSVDFTSTLKHNNIYIPPQIYLYYSVLIRDDMMMTPQMAWWQFSESYAGPVSSVAPEISGKSISCLHSPRATEFEYCASWFRSLIDPALS